MYQIEAFAIKNPCRGVCESNNAGFCKGCGRNRDERFYWGQLPEYKKRRILELCSLRLHKWQLLQNRAARALQLRKSQNQVEELLAVQQNLLDEQGCPTTDQSQRSIFSLPQIAPENME